MLEHMDQAYFENLAREKAIRDHNQMMLESWESGFAEGFVEKFVEGYCKGFTKALAGAEAMGIKKGHAEIIQLMLETMSYEQVAHTLKMSIEDIQEIVNT